MCQATNFQNSATNFQNSEMKVAVSYSDFGGGLVQHRGKKYCRPGDFDVFCSGAAFANMLPGWSFDSLGRTDNVHRTELSLRRQFDPSYARYGAALYSLGRRFVR